MYCKYEFGTVVFIQPNTGTFKVSKDERFFFYFFIFHDIHIQKKMHGAPFSYFTPLFSFGHHSLQDHDLHSAAAESWLSSCHQ